MTSPSAASAAALPHSFDEMVRQSSVPVLVDFWAEWCGPCRTVAPVIAQIAREFKGTLRVVKVNIDDKPHVAQQYAIQSIPTIMLFRDGAPILRQSGALPFGTLKAQIERALGSS